MTAADPTWLDLRSPFDDAARSDSLHLVDRVAAALRDQLEDTSAPVTAVDIGAGTGNSARWFAQHLATRLPGTTLRWVLLDADDQGLVLARQKMSDAKTVVADITQLPGLIGELRTEPEYAGPLVMTASAVLDVLTQVDVDAIVEALVQHSGCGLFLLSINGDWRIDPTDSDDDYIKQTFADHQQRDERLGADGARTLIEAARRAGLATQSHVTTWHMAAPEDGQMIERFLRERVAAVIDHQPQQQDLATAWLQRRMGQLSQGLTIEVDHLDVALKC